jgi:tetratricopeptide (TPR) repeat protein
VFVALSRRSPVIVFVDDWQWADDAARQVLSAIRQSDAGRILILTAQRELQSGNRLDQHDEVMHLPPFDGDEVATAILTLWPEANPFQVQEVRRRSGGNALYIEELCHWAMPEPVTSEDDRTGTLPAWLSTLIESRVARLPANLAAVVQVAAVAGVVVPVWLLEQVAGQAANGALIGELAERDLIYRGEVEGTLRFKHGITRDVIYASISPRERQQLHRRVAECLQQRQTTAQEALLEVLAYHFRAGAMPDEAAHYAELAGDRALAAAAPDRARSQYLAALAAIDELEPGDAIYRRWRDIVHRLGLACVFDPARSHLPVFTRAVDRAREQGDPEGMARAEYWLGFFHYALGDNDDAICHYERAIEYCTDAAAAADAGHDPRALKELSALRVQLMATIGQARGAAGEHDAALQLFDQALLVKRHHRRRSSPAVGSAYTLACRGATLGDLGRFDEAHACFDEALEAIRPGHLPVESSILGWRSAVLLWQGRWSDARESASRAEALAQRVGSLYVLAQGQASASYASWMLDRNPESLDAIARATSWLEYLDRRLSISINYGWLVEAMAMAGRWRDVRHYAQRAIERALVRDPFGEAPAYRALACEAWTQTDEAAAAFLDRAMEIAQARRSTREEAVTMFWQGRLAAERQRAHEAAESLTRASARFAAMGMSWHDAQAKQALASFAPGG